jgi:2-C-methyl-D-erythritol 4-phosphate cytidylyltransferase
MTRTYAIILAGGRGLRLDPRRPKQFLPLGGKPVIAWSLGLCETIAEIDHILTVIQEEFIPEAEKIAAAQGIHKILKFVPGGSTRQESAYNALTSVPFSSDDILLFHDAARPFISPETVRTCISETALHGAAAIYVPVNDTIAEISDGFVISIPPRERMFYAQTPQCFKYSIISKAHENSRNGAPSATDDVSLVLAAGFSVKMIRGDYSNFKITTDFDYQAACRMAESMTDMDPR